MAISTKAIKNRITSVQNTRKITRAMEMVAAAKMKKAVDRSLKSRRYAELALELLANISREKDIRHPLLEKRDPIRKELLIIIASNKGLCGGYNVNIYKTLHQYMKKNQNRTYSAITIGRYAERYAKKMKMDMIGSFIEFKEDIDGVQVGGIAKLVIEEFTRNACDRTTLLYTQYHSPIKQEARTQHLLPIKKDMVQRMIEEAGGTRQQETPTLESLKEYLFEPDKEEVLAQVLPALTEIQLYQAILESTASEQSARMVAMKNASDNAKGMVEELSLWYNKARQAAITQEIVEIATGAEAIAG